RLLRARMGRRTGDTRRGEGRGRRLGGSQRGRRYLRVGLGPEHLGRQSRLALLQRARDVSDELARELELRSASERMRAFPVVEGDRVLVRAERLLRDVGGDERDALARELLLRVRGEILALGGEPDAEWRVPLLRDPGEDVGVLRELERGRMTVHFL